MTTKRSRRRGVVLSLSGQRKLEASRRHLEKTLNQGDRFTFEELSERTQLALSTITRVLDAQVGVDKQTLDQMFAAFDLLLERADYQHSNGMDNARSPSATTVLTTESAHGDAIDWGEATDVSTFYGRTAELATLDQWIQQDRCRLIAILGMGGIGKTALAVKLARQIQAEFESVIWRSLRNAPSLETLLAELVPFLSNQRETKAEVGRLIHYLRQHRCLVILDNGETILQGGDCAGQFRAGYEAYGQLLRVIGETSHQSCLILTSREKPSEIAAFEGIELAVRSLQLGGSEQVAQALLQSRGLIGSVEQKQQLGHCYGNNPLALKVVSTSIQDLFEGEIEEFLGHNTTIFNGIRRLLDQQFNRLSPLEQTIMYWLAINREWTTIAELHQDIVPAASKANVLEALESLAWRSLIEKKSGTYTQQPVVMEYVSERLIEQMISELSTAELLLFLRYALIKTTVKDYVRESQTRLILQPIANGFRQQFSSLAAQEQQILPVLTQLRHSEQQASYGAGNLLNLLSHLNIDLTGYDLSHLVVWQAYLVKTKLHHVNFTRADTTNSVFAEALAPGRSNAFSPDGEILATTDFNRVRLWRLSTGQQLLTLLHDTWVWRLSFSPNGKVLACGSIDNIVRLWDIPAGRYIKILEGETDGCTAAAFSSDSRIFVGSHLDTVKLWDTETWTCIQTLYGHTQPIMYVAISPQPTDSGQCILASTGYDMTVRLWDLHTGECLHVLEGHSEIVWHVTFNPNGWLLASSSMDGTIRLWDVRSGKLLKTLEGHTNYVTATAFIPNTQTLVSSSFDSTLKQWNVQTGQCIKTLLGHSGDVWCVTVSPNGQILASNGGDKIVRLWDTKTGQCVKTFQGESSQIYGVAVSQDRQILASGSDDKLIKLWNLQTGQCIKTLQGHTDGVWALAFNPSSQLLATGSVDSHVKLWDVQTGQCLKTLQGHTATVYGIAISPDGKWLVSCGGDNLAKLWNIQTGQCLQNFEGHDSWIWSCVLTPNGQLLATASDDRTIKLWDVQTGQCRQTLRGHGERVWSVAVSPDGQWLASGSDDCTAKLWNILAGECLNTMREHASQVKTVVFSPDGQTLATGSQDQTIRLWTLDGECLKSLKGHTNAVSSLAVFSLTQDESILVSGSNDETIRLWDVQSGECLKILRDKRIYEGMDITGVTGITEAQKATLKALGAVEEKG